MSPNERAGEGRTGFWRRRVLDPVVFLLAQGLAPDALALSLAVGLVLGLFPIIGATTALCVLLRLPLRRLDATLRRRDGTAPA